MFAKITLYDGTIYKIADKTTDTEDGIYLGRIKDELSLVSAMQEAGNAPATINLTIINDDDFIPHNKDLWAAEVLLTNENNISWRGKINFCNFDADGNLYVTASEKTAPELELQLPDEVRQVYTVDEDFHQSSVTMTIPLVIGGTTSNPITLPTILIDKTKGIYLICVGEIRSIVKVYNGAEQLPQTAYTAYTGTADQQENAGFAYVKINEDYRLNADGSYAEINVEVVGLKLGDFTEEECRNGALFLYYFLTTAATGINGWGCGIDTDLIDTDSFQSAITLCNQLGYKLDGIMWLRQSAQSWIDQICQAIHGKYSINANGKRSLFIDYAGNASKKTFTASNMRVDRYGKNSYTSVVYNKGVLSYDYNPITGLFMQSAQYENAESIAQIGEQKFVGESYLLKDPTTALAVLEYTCKRSQTAAEAIEFKTDDINTLLKAGDVITINRPDLSINNALYQIQNISITDYEASISAVKFDTSVFIVSGTPSSVNWGSEKAITPALTPAQATNLLLSTGFDINPDGTGTPYISGTFTVPDGGWLAAAVQYGIGTNPQNWTELALITEGKFKLSPVNVGTVYSVRVRMITSTGHSDYITGQITATGDSTPPLEPTIVAKATDRTVTIQCGLDNPPYDMGGFQIYRKKSTEQVYTLIGSVAANRGYASFSDYVDEYVTYNYQAKSYDRSGNLSTNFSNVASVTVIGIQANDVAATALSMPTGSILRLSAKNCHGAEDTGNEYPNHISDENGVKDVSGNGNHGQAYGGVSVLDGGEGFEFHGAGNGVEKIKLPSNFLASDYFTLSVRIKNRGVPTRDNLGVVWYGAGIELDYYGINHATNAGKFFVGVFVGGTRFSFITNTTSVLDGDWHNAVVTFDGHELKFYFDGVFDSLLEKEGVRSNTNTPYIGTTGSSYDLNAYVSDLRIYPRALSASEIKTLYMFPDDVTFGQLTADLIGANIIKAENLIKTESLITTVAQIDQAVVNNLNVSGNATFVGLSNKVTAKYGTCSTAAATAAKVVTLSDFSLFTGAQISVKFTNTNSVANPTLNVNSTGAKTIRAKGANLTASSLYNWVANDVVDFVYDGTYWVISDISAKDYSNTELAKKMSIASYCASNDTTKIDGANIYAGSVTTQQLASKAITAEKIDVTAISSPYGATLNLGFDGCTTNSVNLTNGVINLGNRNVNIGNGTASAGCTVSKNSRGTSLYMNGSSYASLPNPLGSSPSNFTIYLRFYLASVSSSVNQTIFCCRSEPGKGYSLFIIGNTTLRLDFGSQYPINKTLAGAAWHDIIVTRNSSKLSLCIDGEWVNAGGAGSATGIGSARLFIGAGHTSQSSLLSYLTSGSCFRYFAVWDRVLTEGECNYLLANGIDIESGQITADRIATDAIKSRNFSGSTDGSAFSTYGSYLDLAGGNFVTPFLRLRGSSANKDCQIGKFKIDSTGWFRAEDSSNNTKMALANYGLTLSLGTSSDSTAGTNIIVYDGLSASGWVNDGNQSFFSISVCSTGNSYGESIVKITPPSTSKYGLYVAGKARINTTDYTSDESTKKDFQDVSTLDKLKALRVCAWRFDEEKLVEKDNAFIDAENIKIEAENKAIDTENAEIEKENEKRKNRKDGEPVELIPLKERKKLREHRIADKTANHPLNIGCMAGEFNKAFGTNDGSEDCLSVTDTIGVCMRAIQELAEISDTQKAEIAELKAKLKIQQEEQKK